MNIMHNLPKRRVGRSSVSLWTQSQAIKKKNKKNKQAKKQNKAKCNTSNNNNKERHSFTRQELPGSWWFILGLGSPGAQGLLGSHCVHFFSEVCFAGSIPKISRVTPL